jgi:phasin
MMTATSNPQVSANPKVAVEQARKNYDATPDVALPEVMRVMAEKTVAQTREVYDRSKDALDASLSTLERTFDAAGQGAAAFNRKIIDIAQRNVNSGFDLAKSLAGAKNLADVMELQAAYWRKLFSTLTAQAEEVRALSTKVTADAGEPLKEQVKRGVDELGKAN